MCSFYTQRLSSSISSDMHAARGSCSYLGWCVQRPLLHGNNFAGHTAIDVWLGHLPRILLCRCFHRLATTDEPQRKGNLDDGP